MPRIINLLKLKIYSIIIGFLFVASCARKENLNNKPTTVSVYTEKGIRIFKQSSDHPVGIKLSGDISIIMEAQGIEQVEKAKEKKINVQYK